jgi:hypothetical protein
MVAAGWGLASGWAACANDLPAALRAVSESYEDWAHDMMVLMITAFERPPAVCPF